MEAFGLLMVDTQAKSGDSVRGSKIWHRSGFGKHGSVVWQCLIRRLMQWKSIKSFEAAQMLTSGYVKRLDTRNLGEYWLHCMDPALEIESSDKTT